VYFDCNSACYRIVVIACKIERACSFDGLGETYSVTAVSCWHHSGETLADKNVCSYCWQILRSKRSSPDQVYIVFWVVLGEIRATFPHFFIYTSRHEIKWVFIIFNYTSLKTLVPYKGFRATEFAPLLEVKFLLIRRRGCWCYKTAEGILASGRSQCSCRLNCRSETAWLLGSRVWILLRAWMCVCFVLSRQRSLLRADHTFRSLPGVCDLETSTICTVPEMGCCDTKDNLVTHLSSNTEPAHVFLQMPTCFSYSSSTWFQVMASPYGASRSRKLDTTHSVGLLWASGQPDAETSTWQHTTPTNYNSPCLREDSNPQSQQGRGRRPTPQIAWPLLSAYIRIHVITSSDPKRNACRLPSEYTHWYLPFKA